MTVQCPKCSAVFESHTITDWVECECGHRWCRHCEDHEYKPDEYQWTPEGLKRLREAVESDA